MKIMNCKLLIGMALILSSVGAQAFYCSGECTIFYKDIVGKLSVNSTMTQKEDFKLGCIQHLRGTLQYVGNGPYEYFCVKTGSDKVLVTGQASDIFQAQANTRSACSQRASSSGHAYAVGSIYGHMKCN